MTLGAASDRRRLSVAENELLRVQLDCLPCSTALLDQSGRILAVNGAWRRFARTEAADEPAATGVGLDYAEICSEAEPEGGRRAREGIEQVLSGRRDTFELVYACHSPTQMRWCRLTANRPRERSALVLARQAAG